MTAGLVLHEDPDWFFLLGAPGNLLAAVGFVVVAVVGRQRGRLSGWAAVRCGVGGLLALAMAESGTSALIGGFWLAVAAGRAGISGHH